MIPAEAVEIRSTLLTGPVAILAVRRIEPWCRAVQLSVLVHLLSIALAGGYLTATLARVSLYDRRAITIETGIQSAYACLAARESALTGRFVKVRQVGF